MAATTTQTIRLLACPACGARIELHTTYDVHLGDIEPSANAKVSKATATLTITGVHIQHECPPPKPLSFFTEGGNPLARGGVVTTHNPVIRED